MVDFFINKYCRINSSCYIILPDGSKKLFYCNYYNSTELYNKFYYDARSSEYDSEEFNNFWFNRTDNVVTLTVTIERSRRNIKFTESPFTISNLYEESWEESLEKYGRKYSGYRINGEGASSYDIENLINDTTNKYIKDIHKKVIYSKL